MILLSSLKQKVKEKANTIMLINGLLKLTLLDYPEKTAATIFTGGCNFRCPFCHNASIVLHYDEMPQLSEEEILKFLSTRTGLLDGVCITGGEPLLQVGLVNFIEKIKLMGFLVKLDTNGSFPEKLIELVSNGLIDYVAMDIKNSKESYARTIGLSNLADSDNILKKINQSIEFLLADNVDYEFRTTVIKNYHTSLDFKNIGFWIHGAKKYFLQNFVDSGDLIQSHIMGVTEKELKKFAEIVKEQVPSVQIRGL